MMHLICGTDLLLQNTPTLFMEYYSMFFSSYTKKQFFHVRHNIFVDKTNTDSIILKILLFFGSWLPYHIHQIVSLSIISFIKNCL